LHVGTSRRRIGDAVANFEIARAGDETIPEPSVGSEVVGAVVRAEEKFLEGECPWS